MEICVDDCHKLGLLLVFTGWNLRVLGIIQCVRWTYKIGNVLETYMTSDTQLDIHLVEKNLPMIILGQTQTR